MADFETLRFTIDGVDKVVMAIGHGPVVVCLHGAATLEGFAWAAGMANRFRVYLPYHPGFGQSGAAPHIVGMQDMVVHTLNLMDAMGLDRPHLVGHSMGGWMASEIAVVAGGSVWQTGVDCACRVEPSGPSGGGPVHDPAAGLAGVSGA